MTMVEKVVAGMEWALENMIDPINDFRFAGYDGPALLMNVPIIQDAITVLKALEPRVMTLDEVMATPKDVAIWQELKDEPDFKYEIGPVAEPIEIIIEDDWDMYLFEKRKSCVGIRFASEGYMPKESYGKTWRCWTSRPTDEQREAEPWN